MSFFDYLSENSTRIAFLFLQHVQVVLISVSFATVISILLAIATEHLPRTRKVALSVTGTILTIPSFALFGLMIPLFGLGVAPTVLALTIYAVFPILRNAVTGLETVDEGVVDAARGMGMDSRRRLWRIRLPLAWPVILNGIRVATIMVVAIAAIGAAVRGPGLGELIFRGLSRMGGANALNEALAGVLAIVVVAAVLDVLFLIIGRVTTPRGLHA
ncbi:osmoprotectant transport system permease protein [Modestobacter sp. DSM 44400]|uniref:ABC transporter permease n=1 Tax=Modestobacter sp. DSM 44400 TaxID=1550230 RepID=UPI00089D945E|nr:ABC transporter permease [Modestobacter sp. DSM 44400]SDY72531.1 osmoprotectant transport system permease protein [Modestobacter sp. DSM 44400]